MASAKVLAVYIAQGGEMELIFNPAYVVYASDVIRAECPRD